MRTVAVFGLALSFVGAFGLWSPRRASASPWTLGRGRAVVYTSIGYQAADREFLDRGSARRFPLRGRFDGTNLTVGARLGLTDDVELEVSLPFSLVSYQADPVILLDQPAGGSDLPLDFFQENVLNFSQTRAGFADIRLAGRYRLARGRFAAALEVGVKAPLGYEGPAGTFGEVPDTAEAFQSDPARFVRRENIQDDVTLGDGQVDLQASLLLGYAFGTGTFVRLSGGYNLRLDGAADEVIGLLRLGQAIGRRWLVYAGSEVAIAIQDGRVIGISVGAVDPALPAQEFGGLTNLLLRELQLAKKQVGVGGGVILRLTDELELNLGYQYTVWGRNTAALHSGSMSLALKVDMF